MYVLADVNSPSCEFTPANIGTLWTFPSFRALTGSSVKKAFSSFTASIVGTKIVICSLNGS